VILETLILIILLEDVKFKNMKKLILLLLFIPLVSFGQKKCEGITVAGGNGEGSSSDQLNYPNGIAFDDSGNLYIADRNNRSMNIINGKIIKKRIDIIKP